MDCLVLVFHVLDRIETIVQRLSHKYGVEVENVWLWKGRACGKCNENSDIDIWMEVEGKVDTEELNRRIAYTPNPLPWEYHKGNRVVWDFRFGVGSPPKPRLSLDELRKLKAKRLSV